MDGLLVWFSLKRDTLRPKEMANKCQTPKSTTHLILSFYFTPSIALVKEWGCKSKLYQINLFLPFSLLHNSGEVYNILGVDLDSKSWEC